MRISFEEAVEMALIRNYKATKHEMLPLESIKNFHVVLNLKLEEMGYSQELPNLEDINLFETSVPENKKIYFSAKNEENKEYMIIKPETGMNDIELKEFLFYPTQILEALETDEVLKTINLINVDGIIVSRSKYYKQLAEKYHLEYELPVSGPKFNIFDEWENIANNGFIENNCLCDKEKMILEELRKNREKQGTKFIKMKK